MSNAGKHFFHKRGFGERLFQARIRQKLSQEALAEAVGTTARSISRWENNQVIPQEYYRVRLSEVLQTTPEALFGTQEESASSLVPLWYVPYTRNAYFTGRGAILSQMYERLHAEHQGTFAQPHMLSGLGGIGKTQLALEYAYHFRDHYQAVFWVGAETTETLMSDYKTLASFLHLPEKDTSDQMVLKEAVKRWFQRHSGWLLIFDNAEDLELLNPMLPNTGQGHILITTRSQMMGTMGFRLELPKMEPAEGALFLLRRANLLPSGATFRDIPAGMLTQAEELVECLDGLPLALDQAGAYIEEAECGLSGYLERYATRRDVLLNDRGSASSHHPASVSTTLFLSFQRVEQASPLAADLLRLCAFLYAEAIPEEFIIQAGATSSSGDQQINTDDVLLDGAIKALRRFSLIHRESETKTLSIHRLLQAIIKDRMEKADQQCWLNRLIQAFLQIFPDFQNRTIEAQPDCQRYLSHALTCVTSLKEHDMASKEAETFLYRVACYLRLTGDYEQAVSLLFQAMHMVEKLFGKEDPRVAFYLEEIADYYIVRRWFQKAEANLQRAVTLYEQGKGSDDLSVADCLWSLANLFHIQGKFARAETCARRAIRIKEQVLGSEHYEIAMILVVLGRSAMLKGEYPQAEQLLQKSLDMYKRTLGETHFFTSICKKHLAKLFYLQGHFIQAACFCQEALDGLRTKVGPLHLQIAEAAYIQGDIFFQQGRYLEAEHAYQRAFIAYEKHPDLGGIDEAHILLDLGVLSLVQGSLKKAQECLRHASHFFGETLRENAPVQQETLRCLLFVGDRFVYQGDLIQAQACYRRVSIVGKQFLGADHPLIHKGTHKLAMLFSSRESS